MSWFKKIFSSQSPQTSTEETIVKFTKQKNETEEKATTTVNEFQDCNEETQSTQGSTQESSCYSSSGVSQSLDIRGEKCGWTDDETEVEPWWGSFKSQLSTQTSSQDSSQKFEYFKLTSNNLQTESESEDKATNNQSENPNEDDKEKISFYLKVGKSKKWIKIKNKKWIM